MKKIIILIIFAGLIVSGYLYQNKIKDFISSFSTQEEKGPKEKISRDLAPRKEVEVYRLGQEEPVLSFAKSGVALSSTISYVTPEISGRVVSIDVEVGDQVNKNQTLIYLGDSLSTNIADIQYQTALTSYDIAYYLDELTQYTSDESYYLAKLNAESAWEAYENAVLTAEHTEEIFDSQIESAEIGFDSAEDAYHDLKNDYLDAEEELENLEEEYTAAKKNPTVTQEELSQMKQAITAQEAQVDALKKAKNSAKDGLEQAELGLEQLKESADSQLDQLNFAIDTSYRQYDAAIVQIESAYVGGKMQEAGTDSQLAQALAALKSAQLNIDQKYVKSPINGIVTSISAQEGNLTAPGQVLLKIENSDKLSVKTSVNEKEVELLAIGDEVTLDVDGVSAKGEIVSISPTLNEISKKIEVEIEVTEENAITPGSFVRVYFNPSTQGRLFIPLNSVFLTQDKKQVKIVDKNYIIQCKDITLGEIIGEYVEITSGLNGTEMLVKAQTTFISDGDAVIVK